MMEDKIQKANLWGSTISNWIKILGIVLTIVGYGFLTYYQIKSNSENINKILMLIEDKEKATTREFEVWGARSDKRYIRAMNEADELHNHDDKQDEQIFELTKELWYMKGKLDERDRN